MQRGPLLLFDLGGVLIENAGFDRLAALVPEPIGSASLKAKWLASPAVRAFELGQLTPEAFATSFVAEWRLASCADDFLSDFARWPKGPYPGAGTLLAALRREYRLACLSNSNVVHWERFGRFTSVFDVALSSHLLGEIKPDRACFEQALIACDVGPGDVRFFDDAPANVEAATRIGIRSFLVDGPIALEKCLRVEGLLRSCTER